MIRQGRKTFSGQGRPRPRTKAGVQRYPGGKIIHADRGESEDSILRTATEARVRRLGVRPEHARDPLLGCALGRLKLLGPESGGISDLQFKAGKRFARCMSLQGILDDVRPAYGVPVLARLSCASGRDPYDRFDPDLAYSVEDLAHREKQISAIRRDAANATSALWEIEAHHPGAAYIVNRVVMWDDIAALDGSELKLGNLRCGLNALDRIWD